MKTEQRVRVAYFGYSVEFTTSESRDDAIRAEANRHIIAKFGPTGDAVDIHNRPLPYVESGVPFPAYVPVLRYDHEGGRFY